MLPRLLDHLRWADRRTAESLATLESVPAAVLTIWAHLLAAEAVWLARLDGVAPPVPVWPTLTLAECTDLAARNHAALARYAGGGDSAGHDRPVTYHNTSGQAFTNTVAEILHHVVLHGMYHRGQLAQAVRDGGGMPLATDLIVYLREGVG
jgi:uncharacterized damage-inducible protein DinB